MPRRSRCSNASSTSTAARRISTASGKSAACSAPSSTQLGFHDPLGGRRVRSSAPATSSRIIPASGPRILLIGHLDTVFEKDSPFQKFERVDDRTARGPGIIDMKGGDVVMIGALKALQSAGVLKTMNVVVVMTGDEEDSGRAVERGARSTGRLPRRAPISRLASRTVRPIRSWP